MYYICRNYSTALFQCLFRISAFNEYQKPINAENMFKERFSLPSCDKTSLEVCLSILHALFVCRFVNEDVCGDKGRNILDWIDLFFLLCSSNIPIWNFLLLSIETEFLQVFQYILTHSAVLVMRPATEAIYWLFILLASQNWFELQGAVTAAGLVGMDLHRGTSHTNFRVT
jgi:hypothetical protein